MNEPLAPTIVHPCPNCGADAADAYCPRCGQSQTDRLRVSLRSLAAEGVAELTDLDAKLWTTLRLLFTRPGHLTREYLAGRRARYVRPLRLYLSASVLFFVAYAVATRDASEVTSVFGVQIGGGDDPSIARTRAPAAPQSAATPVEPVDAGSTGSGLTVGGDVADSRIERAIEHRVARFETLSAAEQRRLMVEGVQRHMPKAFFLLVPLSALLLHAVHLGRGLRYAEHLILALHVHVVAFLAATLALAIPNAAGGFEEPILTIAVLAYVFLAMRRVYGRSRGRTLAGFAVVLTTYTLAVVLSLVGALLLTLLV